MSFVIFDVDKSLASIGGVNGVEQLSGVKPITINNGIDEIKSIFSKLFIKTTVQEDHPLFSSPIEREIFQMNDKCKELGIEGIVIDTLSHCFRQDMRLLEKANKTGQMEMKDWGKLERMYNDFISKLTSLPMWVIVNSHITYDKDGATGQFYYAPQVKGSTKDSLPEYFDCVFYTKTNKDKKIYTWQTVADSIKFGKDRLDVLDDYIAQDYSVVLQKYREGGVEYPKILTIGESGTGKTRALMTLKKVSPLKKAA